jgi:hypothetical protein
MTTKKRRVSRSRRALHEVVGGMIGMLGIAGLGGVVGGPLGAFVGAIVGAGMGAAASAAADDNAAQLAIEDRALTRERLRETRLLRQRGAARSVTSRSSL